ncbi:MAG: hypothetical protein A2Y81_00955 [Nitrospirae bacterium RBG_13_43_8]|nr:MAG: hypothetical protein A2Y81_00955 [Nitrospirae bacterium RBG_13_43_8]
MDKVVVIGGSGFLGSHVADELSKQGFTVTILDGRPSLWLRNDQKMVVGDILDREAVLEVIKDARYVYHFAGVADIGKAAAHPFDTIHVNVMGTAVVLEAAIQLNVERFIYASTMYVYSPYGSFYRASKQAAEIVIETYHEKFGLEYTLLRYGSLYGPRAQLWNGLKRYVSQILKEGRISYHGSGNERREYIHVSDAARLSVRVLDKAYKNQAITITGNQILSSNELIEMIFEIAGLPKKVEFADERKGNDHYSLTPYRYTPKQAKKLVPEEFIDIGQGILEIVEEIYHEVGMAE